MRSRHRTLVTLAATLSAASATLVACGGEHSDPQYAKDGDTGAASPATQQTLSPNPQMGDSTQGVRERTGAPAMAGDSSGAGRAARDSAGRAQPGSKRP